VPEFDDCRVIVRPQMTTLRCELPDQALVGVIQRVIDLRFDITRVLLIDPAPAI
jgi:hypothetical protein